jgi:guanylate kinase
VSRGLLIVISGPSGVGKDTLIRRLIELEPTLVYSVSGTTRRPRPGEKPDENYTFLTREEFQDRINKGEFLEHATYNGQLYGTFRDRVEKARSTGRDVVLKIDVQGAEQVRRLVSDGIFIFVVAPSEQERERRQKTRGTESAEDMESRRARWSTRPTISTS